MTADYAVIFLSDYRKLFSGYTLLMKYFLVGLMLFSVTAFGHSQYPSKIVKVPFYQEQTVSINIRNLNSYVQSYEVSVDGRVLGVLENISPNISRRVPVTLKGIEEGTVKIICSTSIPGENQRIRSRVCTKVYFEW